MKTLGKGLIKEIAGDVASDKGFILILALVSMLAMTIIGISLVMNMSTDMQLARNERDGKQAFQLAEAGVNEAIARLRLPVAHARYDGEPEAATIAAAATNPKGYRTTALWPAGSAFNSATSADGLDYAVTVNYLTEQDPFCDDNAGNTNVNGIPAGALNCNNEVVMFGQDFNICFNDIAACTKPSARRGVYPVYRITSTGTVNTTDRTVEVLVGASNLNMDTNGAINTNTCVNAGGSTTIVGGVQEAGACGACDAGIDVCNAKAADTMDTFLSGDPLSSLASSADWKIDCNAINACNADIGAVPDSMWGDCAGDSASSLLYIDTHMDTFSPTISATDLPGGCGRGILIINGNITLSGNMTWEGLIYVMGTLTLNGGGGSGINVTGGIMANNTVTLNGNIRATYDLKTLEDVGRQAGSAAKTYISWRRL
ncbi:MAG: pilus assembly PilX N-terminal domain-containing protein [Deltaproteobacteria bacterium]|nr:pilus assembly PilX N-terminal domain-containing protein [Deltaproteobacteria bacterium]